tara:strand:- start:1143 stop:2147 length:1005 start_codon:yes stop_codon:yes gene_type:complete
MKNYILINGLIRDLNIFKQALNIYIKLRSDNIINDIVIVIDIELKKDGDNIPLGNTLDTETRDFLITNNINIIEIENLSIDEIKKIDPIIESRPRNNLRKNTLSGLSLWRPMYSLKKGLELLEENSYVLKTRADILMSYELLKKIFTEYKIKLENNDLLEYKIWSSGFNEKELLLIMDFTFAGKREDLLKTCHMNGEYLIWGKNNSSGVNNYNTLWWMDIFYKKYPTIKNYYEKYVNKNCEMKFRDEDLYRECIKLYYQILDTYFIIDSGINEYIINQSWGPNNIFNAHSELYKPNNGNIRSEFKNSEWIKKFKKGYFNDNIYIYNIYNEFYNN